MSIISSLAVMESSSVVWRPRKIKTTKQTGPITLADKDTRDTGQKRHRRASRIDPDFRILWLRKITSWVAGDGATASGGEF